MVRAEKRAKIKALLAQTRRKKTSPAKRKEAVRVEPAAPAKAPEIIRRKGLVWTFRRKKAGPPVTLPQPPPPPDLEVKLPEPPAVEEKPPVTDELTPSLPTESRAVTAVTPAAKQPTARTKIPLQIKPVSFLKENSIRILVILLVAGWVGELYLLYNRLDTVRKQVEEVSSLTKPHPPEKTAGGPTPTALLPEMIEIEGIRDPFSNELWRLREITPLTPEQLAVKKPVVPPAPEPIKPILKPPKPQGFEPPKVPKAIPESAKLAKIPSITLPSPVNVTPPATPALNLNFRGILNIAGLDYFFIEGSGGGYRARIGDTVEGFKIYDYRNGTLSLSKDGYTYQINEERVSPPLRYRGRLIMAGEEYFFLQGTRTYRAILGEEIEGYRLVKRIGDYLYFIKDDKLYYLKQE
ncbi:MAG: hypothetical protein V2A65_07080 [Candidatus Omnitrophota bacterium]